ncbi:MAG TPA: YlmC/YmxH family sporulation protein [Gelria sp.]|jgi:YlmC/YmxH family sporulation protein|nr:YlmC/YmxH family sporulation protein [Gelria sp.]
MVRLSDLKAKDVVNILDGKKLGHISDIELDLEIGKVIAIIIPGRWRGFGIFGKREEIVIPWKKIVRIGRDVILVEVPIVQEMDDHKRKGYYLDDDGF